MVVKLPADSVYVNLEVDGEIPVSAFPRESLPTGNVTLSIKFGKRRRLFTGVISAQDEYDVNVGRWYWRYRFRPINLTRLRERFAKYEKRHSKGANNA